MIIFLLAAILFVLVFGAGTFCGLIKGTVKLALALVVVVLILAMIAPN